MQGRRKDLGKAAGLLLVGLAVAVVGYPLLHELGHVLTALVVGARVEAVQLLPHPQVLCDVRAHTLFVIITDGQENASHTYSSDRVKKMIERQKKRYGWEFLFIGANIDAVETAARYGIAKDRAVNYHADRKGTDVLYHAVSDTVCHVRACAPLEADWSKAITEDFSKRSKQ